MCASRAVADYCKIVRQRVNCDGWTTGTNDIVCTINDEKGVHSATYMLRHMQIEAVRIKTLCLSVDLLVAAGSAQLDAGRSSDRLVEAELGRRGKISIL